MNLRMTRRLAAAAAVGLVLTTTAFAQNMVVSANGDRDSVRQPDSIFTGVVTYTPLYQSNDHVNAGAGIVDFTQGARTAWHSHSDGQYFIVTSGVGWVQEEGGEKIEVKAGDVVWTPPNIVHWHGATASNAMSHIAVTPITSQGSVNWMEHVTDEEYLD